MSHERVVHLIDELRRQGVELWFEGERLRFRAPKGTLNAGQRAELGASRLEVLAQLRAEAGGRELVAPLSFNQRSLWFINQEDPESAAYNVAFAARVVSAVDVAALRQALQALVDRHGALRTTFGLIGGVPVQRVAGAGAASLELYHVPGLDEAALRARVASDYRRPFDLERGPLFRTSLYTRAPETHVLLLVIHHIVVDGWSLMQLLDELQALYREAHEGRPASLPRPGREYVEHAAAQELLLAGTEGERLAAYWTRQLAEPRAWLELSTDRPRLTHRGASRAATHAFDLGLELSGRVRQLARDEGVTTFVVLLAAWKTLLFRLTGTEDVIVGTPTFGRDRPEMARVVGDFVNTIPLRSRLGPEVLFRELLGQLRQTVLEGIAAQDYPLPLLVERLQPARVPGRSALFGTLFVLQRFDQLRALEPVLSASDSEEAIDFGGLRLRHHPLDQQEGQFDLTLQVVDRTTFAAQLKFDAGLYDDATIARLAGHYRALLEAAAGAPETALARLTLLTPTDRAALVSGPAAPSECGSTAQTLHQRFEEQVRRSPDATAVTSDGVSLTYRELNRRANLLAHRLRALGVKADALVGLRLDRTLDLVVGVLGILKAGGAYLPIDLSYPTDRVAFMLEDADIRVLVTHGALLEGLPAHRAEVLLIDGAHHDCPDGDPEPSAGADDLAYVIYTSGSTGRPKGVAHHAPRRSTRLFARHGPLVPLRPRRRLDACSTPTPSTSRSGSSGERCCTAAGSSSCRTGSAARPEAFLDLLARERVTVLNQTPSAFRQLLQADAGARAGEPGLACATSSSAARPSTCRPSGPGSSATAIRRRRSSTCTASPRRPCTSPTGRITLARPGRRGRQRHRRADPRPVGLRARRRR